MVNSASTLNFLKYQAVRGWGTIPAFSSLKAVDDLLMTELIPGRWRVRVSVWSP
jgi:hypothetical protein